MIGPAYTYNATVTGLHDADTVTVFVDAGFDIWKRNVVLRLLGINAPEVQIDRKPNQPGLDARDALVALLTSAPTTAKSPVFGIPGDIVFSAPTPVVIQTVKDGTEKYGRLLARVHLTQADGTQLEVNQWLLDNHYAVAYP